MLRLRLFSCMHLLLAFSALSLAHEVQQEQQQQQHQEQQQQQQQQEERQQEEVTMYRDESWPMTNLDAFRSCTTNHDRQRAYQEFMDGCYQKFSQSTCDKSEMDRLAFNAIQPALMKNFTAAGYAKVAMPTQTFHILREYLTRFQDNLEPESWGTQTYTNHWVAETDVHDIERFMPLADRKTIQREVQHVLEGWCGVPLTLTSMYGIRVYRQGAILAPHVDRLPLVISAILNIAQGDKDEESAQWPLEVIGRDGKAKNITLEPGEMILYESHSVIHGRPYPLSAWYYANVFLHFEPFGYSYELKQQLQKPSTDARQKHSSNYNDWARAMFHQALEKRQMNQQSQIKMGMLDAVPPYVIAETEQEQRWKQNFIFQREPKRPQKRQMTAGATMAHSVAASGDLDSLKREVAKDPTVVDRADANGWKPIHEAARGGQHKVIEYLIEKGVDVNERTHNGKGASALWWAQRNFPENHPAVVLLRRHGAVALAPRD